MLEARRASSDAFWAAADYRAIHFRQAHALDHFDGDRVWDATVPVGETRAPLQPLGSAERQKFAELYEQAVA